MKLYTKRGDLGLTDLHGGGRVPKDDLRVEAYGTVDELNSLLSLVISATPEATPEATTEAASGPGETDAAAGGLQVVIAPLRSIQSRLFDLGADLATPPAAGDPQTPRERRAAAVPRLGPSHIAELERWIDVACKDVPPMRHFILPGGTELAARLHVARTVCRRAERRVVALAKAEPVGGDVIVYLNRLSDLLFALARRANHAAGVTDVPWRAGENAGA